MAYKPHRTCEATNSFISSSQGHAAGQLSRDCVSAWKLAWIKSFGGHDKLRIEGHSLAVTPELQQDIAEVGTQDISVTAQTLGCLHNGPIFISSQAFRTLWRCHTEILPRLQWLVCSLSEYTLSRLMIGSPKIQHLEWIPDFAQPPTEGCKFHAPSLTSLHLSSLNWCDQTVIKWFPNTLVDFKLYLNDECPNGDGTEVILNMDLIAGFPLLESFHCEVKGLIISYFYDGKNKIRSPCRPLDFGTQGGNMLRSLTLTNCYFMESFLHVNLDSSFCKSNINRSYFDSFVLNLLCLPSYLRFLLLLFCSLQQ